MEGDVETLERGSMNIAALQALYSAPANELAGQLLEACDALPLAANTANTLVRDSDRAALDILERLTERANGIARLAMRTHDALNRDTQPPRAA